jgi:hypothetical protein
MSDSTSSDGDGAKAGAESTVTKVKRRLGRDLFGAGLGAEPAIESVPPGVPASKRGAATTDAARSADTADAPVNGSATSTAARRGVTTRDAVVTSATLDDSPLPDVAEPAIIDSSMDSGVVAVVEPTPARRGRHSGLRARRVHRIIRRIDPWSVLKLSLLFYFCVWLMVVVSGVLIWGVAVSSGTVDSLEGFIENLLAFEEFTFNADQIFRLFAMGGLIMVFLATAISAILALLFNLISDLIGGIRVTVIEEESIRRIVSPD